MFLYTCSACLLTVTLSKKEKSPSQIFSNLKACMYVYNKLYQALMYLNLTLFPSLCPVGVRLKPHLRDLRSWREIWAPRNRSWRSGSGVWRCGSANSLNSPTPRWVPHYPLSTLRPPSYSGQTPPTVEWSQHLVFTLLFTCVFPQSHYDRDRIPVIFLLGEVEIGRQWNEN